LDLEHYPYWGEQIDELQKVVGGPPNGFRQLALDRNRNKVLAFSTFWMATVVAILTVISLVTGVVSTVYAKKAYNLAWIQYEVSLAQACAEPGVKETLLRFCP
jgi:hypothetical protein